MFGSDQEKNIVHSWRKSGPQVSFYFVCDWSQIKSSCLWVKSVHSSDLRHRAWGLDKKVVHCCTPVLRNRKGETIWLLFRIESLLQFERYPDSVYPAASQILGCHKDKEEQGTLKPKRCLLPVHANINLFSFSSSWHTKFLFFLNITAITEWTDWKTPKELPSPKKGIILHFWWFRQLVRVCIKFGFQIVKEHFLPLQLLVSHSDNFPV